MGKAAVKRKIYWLGKSFSSLPSDHTELLILLEKTENVLSYVEQAPSKSMLGALLPIKTGLSSKELLRHPDAEIRLVVTICLNEIMRITAPDAPYDDDLLKEIFQLFVGALENLDEISSPSYSKRVAILETIAKVRSSVIMLDLDCGGLILDMFRHFLKTIRDDHVDIVSSSMEAIMSLVLEESEEISPELLSLLLKSLRKDNKEILPVARKLVEKVFTNCSLKLKSYLNDAIKSLGGKMSDYSAVVRDVCLEKPIKEVIRLTPSPEFMMGCSPGLSRDTGMKSKAARMEELEDEVACLTARNSLTEERMREMEAELAIVSAALKGLLRQCAPGVPLNC